MNIVEIYTCNLVTPAYIARCNVIPSFITNSNDSDGYKECNGYGTRLLNERYEFNRSICGGNGHSDL